MDIATEYEVPHILLSIAVGLSVRNEHVVSGGSHRMSVHFPVWCISELMVGCVYWLSTLFRVVFHRVLRFPGTLIKKQHMI